VVAACDRLFRRLQETGVLRAEVDPIWARRVYYALLHEGCEEVNAVGREEADIDTIATQLIDTLLRGVGTPANQL